MYETTSIILQLVSILLYLNGLDIKLFPIIFFHILNLLKKSQLTFFCGKRMQLSSLIIIPFSIPTKSGKMGGGGVQEVPQANDASFKLLLSFYQPK